MTLAMDDIAFSDWPGQSVDLSGTNSWLPAYGFQPSHALLEQDFIGNPDADLFLHGSASQHYVYLETIQEETSDDLRSDSDLSDSRASPAGWLATDSETGSVIRLDRITLQEIDSGSERDLACPAKRRRQELTVGCSDDESLSRSSSLLQFETIEKQCQDISSSSPSILSSFSFDSLERKNIDNVSPDSLDRVHSDGEPECDFYKTFKIDLPATKNGNNNNNNNINCNKSDQRNGSSYISDSSSDSSDSSRTLEILRYDSCKSMNRLSRSFENLNFPTQKSPKEKLSTENLSEDSGYSDHLTSFMKLKSSSISNLDSSPDKTPEKEHVYKTFWNSGKSSNFNFSGYETFHFKEQNFASNFGSSCQDLTVLDKYEFRSPLIERFAKRRLAKSDLSNRTNATSRPDTSLNLEKTTASVRTKYKQATSASEPNLLRSVSCTTSDDDYVAADVLLLDEQSAYFENNVCVSSVPKDLNLIGEQLKEKNNNWTSVGFSTTSHSIAVQNWDIADLKKTPDDDKENAPVKETTGKLQPLHFQLDPHVPELFYDMSYKREGSYTKAMQNRIDIMSDEELPIPKNVRHSTIVEFDRKVLKTISETSLRSLTDSNSKLNMPFTPPPISSQRRNVASTPNLAECKNNVQKHEDVTHSSQNIARKSSLIDQSSNTSDDRTLTSAKSFTGSTNSKGVHFCPVVSEVNWRDRSESRTTSTEKDSTYSLSSSTPDLDNEDGQRDRRGGSPKLMKPVPVRGVPNEKQHSISQPDLFDNDERKEIIQHMKDLLDFPSKNVPRGAVSQPNLTGLKRRSSLMQKEVDGTFVRAYIASDGIAYRHTHLVDGSQQSLPTTSSASHVDSFVQRPQQQHQQFDKREVGSNVYVAKPVSDMESVAKHRDSTSKSSRASGKIGGFFSRIASFRFSNRKNDKKKQNHQHQQQKSSSDNAKVNQRTARKEDYIYIPLKGSEEEEENKKHQQQQSRKDNNNHVTSSSSKMRPSSVVKTEQVVQVVNEGVACVSAKPPLPKLPPRVIGASVKKRPDASATPAHVGDAATDGRTIDSGDALPRPMEPMGLIETDLDTEVTVITSGAHAKTRSLMNLGADAPPRTLAAPQHPARPHKSMEFLLDKQNLKVVEPPENELQKGERVMSEHQLRIQRSLQKLTIPEWYKQSEVPQEGFLLRKNSNNVRERWTGTASRTPSLTSIGSNNVQSPLIVSPTPQNQPFVRWSTSKINSTASSPCASTRSSFNARQPNGSISPCSIRSSFNYRQPYLGWRSQERLSRPRTPAERLASSLLSHSHQQNDAQQQQGSPEIQTSIKEVTSAIVHYVSGLRPDEGNEGSSKSVSASPRGSQKLCWLESSFVGTRPLDSPQTPVTLTESHASTSGASSSLRLDLHSTHNEVQAVHYTYAREQKPSPNSTTLEDVLDSLLGLPPSTRAPSPSLAETASVNTSPGRLGEESRTAEQYRRHSEGSDTVNQKQHPSFQRRISFDSTPILRCRYNRCGKTIPITNAEAREFKSCHNCSYTYCSRQCRRAHWEKHRKICLFSRIGSLCRQVLTSVKENSDSLLQISLVARRGYLANGPGAVKCFFPCPENAEKFLVEGLPALGDLTYVPRTGLLPSEMGTQMYSEIMNMCKNYNPDSKLVLYVSVCVVSEAPTAGSVKWERQLVSRCAKMRLSKNVPLPGRDVDIPETYIFTCVPTFDVRIRGSMTEKLMNELGNLGVDLQKKYPEVRNQLQSFALRNFERFTPITIYPYIEETGKCFMCIIMLDAEPDSVRQVAAAGVQARTINLR